MFGNLGKMASMLKDMQGLKANMERMKSELANAEYTGKSCNGQVTAIVSGELLLKRIDITPAFVNAGDTQALQQAILEAVNTASLTARSAAAEKMSALTGGMDIPGL
jgi:DNA-binding YbaB/EbfC family protein